MEIRLARHGRHIAIVSIDNQLRLNALTRLAAGRPAGSRSPANLRGGLASGVNGARYV
jgi:hypothetical protein